MSGMYPNLLVAVRSLVADEGVAGLYQAWRPAFASKV